MVIFLKQTLKGWSIFTLTVGFEFEGIYFPAKIDFTTIRNSYLSISGKKNGKGFPFG